VEQDDRASGEKPPTYTRYGGRTVTTISEEMSVSRLVRPRKTTVRLTRAVAVVERERVSRRPYPRSTAVGVGTW
jgi:hypothetical protein